MNPVHTFPRYFPKIECNITLPSTPNSSKWPLPFRFSDQHFYAVLLSLLCVLDDPPTYFALIQLQWNMGCVTLCHPVFFWNSHFEAIPLNSLWMQIKIFPNIDTLKCNSTRRSWRKFSCPPPPSFNLFPSIFIFLFHNLFAFVILYS
jgi:hypothetical protein